MKSPSTTGFWSLHRQKFAFYFLIWETPTIGTCSAGLVMFFDSSNRRASNRRSPPGKPSLFVTFEHLEGHPSYVWLHIYIVLIDFSQHSVIYRAQRTFSCYAENREEQEAICTLYHPLEISQIPLNCKHFHTT